MKILAVADIESKFFYDFYIPGKLDGFDLIIACGDLKAEYLEFLVTMADCPLLYIHGNHDENQKESPEGCICIDDKLYVYNGVRIVGLGGSYRYREGKYMYSEKQMKRRVRKILPSIFRHRGFDILVTHAPARHINDFDTLPHRGFDCFNKLIERYKPKFFLHGHIHRNYGTAIPQKTEHGKTTVVNAYNYCVIEI